MTPQPVAPLGASTESVFRSAVPAISRWHHGTSGLTNRARNWAAVIAPPPVWPQPDGAPVSCREKLKMLAENHAELGQAMQDAFEDAVLMGCDETQFKAAMLQVIGGLSSGYTHAAAAGVAGRAS